MGFPPWLGVENKKQCSRQLQCEVPCGVGNVINSSLFINSSLSSLSSTSHAICRGSSYGGGSGCKGVWAGAGGWGRGAGDISIQLPLPHYHMVLRPKGTSHNKSQLEEFWPLSSMKRDDKTCTLRPEILNP